MNFTDSRKKILPKLLAVFVCAALAAGGILLAGSSSTDAATISKVKGIDVSAWNGSSLNWKKAASNGVKFAIIRVGGRYLLSGEYFPDYYYKRNITEAYKNGIKVGIYFYSEATTPAEARAEANYVIKRLKPYKSKITLPVAMDMESPMTTNGKYTHWGTAWKNGKLSKTKIVDTFNAFAKVIRANGYTPMFYSYTYWCKTHVNMTRLKSLGYPFWLAEYNTYSTPRIFHSIFGSSRVYEIWQHTSSGRISGFNSSSTVDMNRWYTSSLTKFAKTANFTGKATVTAKTLSQKKIALSWKAVSGATKYKIQRKNGTSWSTLGTITKRTYTDSGLKPKTSYTYRVLACQDSDPGTWSTAVTAKTKALAAFTTAPGLTATVSEKTITAEWDKINTATSYKVTCTETGSGDVKTASVTTDTKKFTGLSYGKTYTIKVVPYKNNTAGKAASVTVKTNPVFTSKATGLKTIKRTREYVKITWTKAPGAEKYEVYAGNGTMKKIATVTGNTYTDEAKAIKRGAARYYKIRAVKGAQSTFSAVSLHHSALPYSVKDKKGVVMTYTLGGKYYRDKVAGTAPFKKYGKVRATYNLRKSAPSGKIKLRVKKGDKATLIKKEVKKKSGYWYYATIVHKKKTYKGWIFHYAIMKY